MVQQHVVEQQPARRKALDSVAIARGGAVVDWNPSGVAIMSQYKWGGACNNAEEDCEPLPQLQWLAARHCQLADVPPEVCRARLVMRLGCSEHAVAPASTSAHAAHMQCTERHWGAGQ